jgi:hypothetical protein
MSWRPFLRLDGLLFGQQEKVATFQSSASIKKGWNQNVSIWVDFWRRDTQHNDTQHNDIQHNDIQHNDIQHNDIQHSDAQSSSKSSTG